MTQLKLNGLAEQFLFSQIVFRLSLQTYMYLCMCACAHVFHLPPMVLRIFTRKIRTE